MAEPSDTGSATPGYPVSWWVEHEPLPPPRYSPFYVAGALVLVVALATGLVAALITYRLQHDLGRARLVTATVTSVAVAPGSDRCTSTLCVDRTKCDFTLRAPDGHTGRFRYPCSRTEAGTDTSYVTYIEREEHFLTPGGQLETFVSPKGRFKFIPPPNASLQQSRAMVSGVFWLVVGLGVAIPIAGVTYSVWWTRRMKKL
jgi:hypothetical protein